MVGIALLCGLSTISAATPGRASNDDWTRCMTAGGRPSDIVSACTGALRANPGLPPRQRALFIEARSDALLRAHRRGEAMAGYTAAIRLRPRDMEAYHGRGSAWLAAGQYALAARDLTTALTCRQILADEAAVSDIDYERAAAYRALGNTGHRLADGATARELDHRRPVAANVCP